MVIKMVNKLKNKMLKNKLGQNFSTDIIIVAVVVLFGVLFLVMNKINVTDDNQDYDSLTKKADLLNRVIIDELKKTEVIDDENHVQLEELLQLDTNELKETLSLPDDFCIVFEKDGKLIQIDSRNGINGIGSENIIVNDVRCKSN